MLSAHKVNFESDKIFMILINFFTRIYKYLAQGTIGTTVYKSEYFCRLAIKLLQFR